MIREVGESKAGVGVTFGIGLKGKMIDNYFSYTGGIGQLTVTINMVTRGDLCSLMWLLYQDRSGKKEVTLTF